MFNRQSHAPPHHRRQPIRATFQPPTPCLQSPAPISHPASPEQWGTIPLRNGVWLQASPLFGRFAAMWCGYMPQADLPFLIRSNVRTADDLLHGERGAHRSPGAFIQLRRSGRGSR
jgi:hypothetical protein